MKEVIFSQEISKLAAEKFVEIANDSIAERGQFTVALSGGSTPKSLYKLLKSEEFRNQIDWQKIFFFFGDERNVMPNNKESNFRTAKYFLFTSMKINLRENVFRWQTELRDPPFTAEIYSTNVKNFFNGFPRFDLIFLGMGADGHTASLFPHTPALHETERIAVENWVEKLQTWRFTLTFPTINNARNVIFLIAGADKTKTLREVLEGEFEPEKLPSQMIAPTDGNLLILTDIEL